MKSARGSLCVGTLKCLRLFYTGILLFALSYLFQPKVAFAVGSLPFDQILQNAQKFLDPNVVKEVVGAVGNTFIHRAYEPATGTKYNLDIGIEIGIVQVPGRVGAAFQAAGLPFDAPPSLPDAKYLNVHKGLSQYLEIGASYLGYAQYHAWGADVKVTVFQPEEGPTVALRLSYTSISIPIGDTTQQGVTGSLSLNTSAYSPQLVVSKALEFADPYIGIGYQAVLGDVQFDLSGTPVPGVTILESTDVKGQSRSFVSFIGVSFLVPNLGLKLVFQGEYNIQGYNSIGGKIGFRF